MIATQQPEISETSVVLEREADHHDEWAASVDANQVDILSTWEGIGCPEVAWIASQLGDLRGKKVLDLGSGLGEGAVWFALQGADVIALDISPGMLEVVSAVARRHGVSVSTVVGSATDLGRFANGTFDIVYGANMLHHVNIPECLDEVQRVLRVGGKAAFWDPVKYNPAIELYRKLASGVRTEDEHPLEFHDLGYLRTRFSDVHVQGFWLSALALFARFFFVDRIHPSADRYWKLAVERQHKHQHFLRIAHRVDRALLKLVPPLRWMCWNMAIVCTR
jgi:SAM-dependent methyltransferase